MTILSGAIGVPGAGLSQSRHDHAVHQGLPTALHPVLHAQGGDGGGGPAVTV